VEQPLILPGARKHGFSDEDILHAWRNPIRVFEQDDDMTIFVGPALNADLLEVGTLSARDFNGVIIAHCMRARRKYLR